MCPDDFPRLVIHLAPEFTGSPLTALVDDFATYHESAQVDGELDHDELVATLPPWLLNIAECSFP